MKSEKDIVLEKFMKENFPYPEFKKMGFFTKEMKGDYKAMAEKICWFFGYKTVYEYGAKEIRCHLTLDDRLTITEDGIHEEPFIIVIPSLFD